MAKIRVKKKSKFIRFLAFVLLIVCVLNAGPILRRIFPLSHEEMVLVYSNEYDVDYNLVMGVIKAESNFNEKAVSHKGAKGLMQFTDETALWVAGKIGNKRFDVDDICDPYINVEMGCYYLSYLLDKYNNDERTALAAYNAGPGKVDDWLDSSIYSLDGKKLDAIPYNETSNYVNKVLTYKTIFEKLYHEGKDLDE